MKTRISLEIARALLPFIHLFGFYVMIYGHLSPGGGFAGGSILGAALILQRVMFTENLTDKKFNHEFLMRLLAISLILYGAIKSLHFFSPPHGTGGFHIPLGIPGTLFSGGTLMPLNIIIGLVVAITFYFIAVMFEEGSLSDG